MSLLYWCVPAMAVAIAFFVFPSKDDHFSATASMTGSESLNCPFTSRIEIPTLFRTFSTSFNASPVSESTNFPAFIWFILEKILFKAVPIVSSLSCVTSLMVAIMAAVFSRDTPALFACDATFVSACPIPPASEADSRSMLVRTSLI